MRGELPSFSEYRVKNDAVMTPDRGFTKQLHCLDPDMEVVWDWGSEKWEIWKFPKDRPDLPEGFHVLTIQTKDRSYRELGSDILLKLQYGNHLNNLTLNQLVEYFDELDKQVERRKKKEFMNRIEAITKETANYARGVMQVQVPAKVRVRRIVANG
jgi:hypothetical protein